MKKIEKVLEMIPLAVVFVGIMMNIYAHFMLKGLPKVAYGLTEGIDLINNISNYTMMIDSAWVVTCLGVIGFIGMIILNVIWKED